MKPKKRGPKPKKDPEQKELERLRRRVAQLEHKLETAELIIDVQKNGRAGAPSPVDLKLVSCYAQRAHGGEAEYFLGSSGLRVAQVAREIAP